MLKKIAAVVLGIVVAGGLVAVVESIGHTVYPVPPTVDFEDPVQLRNYVATLPPGAFLFVLTAWLAGTFGGGLVASYVSKEKPFFYATIVGAFVLVATVWNLIMIPHPLWVSITAVIGIAVTTYLTSLVALSFVSKSKEA